MCVTLVTGSMSLCSGRLEISSTFCWALRFEMGMRYVKATGEGGGDLLSNVFDVLRQSGSMNTDARDKL